MKHFITTLIFAALAASGFAQNYGQVTLNFGPNGAGIDTSYQRNDSVFIVAGGDEIFTGLAVEDGNGIYSSIQADTGTIVVDFAGNKGFKLQNFDFTDYFQIEPFTGYNTTFDFSGVTNRNPSGAPNFQATVNVNTASGGLMEFRKSRGSFLTPTPVIVGDVLLNITARGYVNSDYRAWGNLQMKVDSVGAGNNGSTHWEFNTVKNQNVPTNTFYIYPNYMRHSKYGLGNAKASDLSKTESTYVALYATDGTFVEKDISEFGSPSGTFTPTFTLATGDTLITNYGGFYTHNDSIVNFSFRLIIAMNPADVSTSFTASLPVASDFDSQFGDVLATLNSLKSENQTSGSKQPWGYVQADTAGDEIEVFLMPDAASVPVYPDNRYLVTVTGQYVVK